MNPSEQGGSSAPRLARLSAWLPISVMMIGGYARVAGQEGNKPLLMLIGFAAIFAAFAGFACGIAALCRRQGREPNVLGRSIAGLVINSSLLLLFLTAFVSGFNRGYTQAVKARQTMASVKRSMDEAKDEVQRSFDPTNGVKADSSDLDKTLGALKKASQELEGESAVVMEASTAYLTELQRLTKIYEAEFKKLEAANLVDASSLKSKEDIQERKQMVQRFLKVNEDVDRFFAAGESNFKSEMVKRKVSQSRIDREVQAYRQASLNRAPLIRAIRAADKRIGNSMLNVLNLLEKDWGNWNYDDKAGEVLFSDTATLDQYKTYLDDIVTSGKQQVALQQRLVSIR